MTQPKTAFDFHQEGKERVKKKRCEKAKMSFASALCLDEENPEYHYSMGEVFYKTANYEQSDRHLTKTMELKNDVRIPYLLSQFHCPQRLVRASQHLTITMETLLRQPS